MIVTEEAIKQQISMITHPQLKKNLLEYLSSVAVRDKIVEVVFEVTASELPVMKELQQSIEKNISNLSNVEKVHFILTTHRSVEKKSSSPTLGTLLGVKSIVAIASGKGGVGKSTTAINIALALRKLGHRVGILDADIYGPSLPRMLGIHEKPGVTEDKKLIPIQKYDLKVMSIGFMVSEKEPIIWRGPMVQGALQQMLKDVVWGDLDVLVVDMPPGTGDIQLTLAQQVSLTGAVIVSTPQDIALVDARKGLAMFTRVRVPILGIVENMSLFCCPKCQSVTEIFGHGGARKEAESLGVPFLGEVPIELSIRQGCDQGTPVGIAFPDSPSSQIYQAIGHKLWLEIEKNLDAQARQTPEITMA